MSTEETPALGPTWPSGPVLLLRWKERAGLAAAKVPEGACGPPPRGRAPASPPGSAARQGMRQGMELLAKGSHTQGPPSTYITVGSASITAPLLPQGLRREGTG